MNYVRLISCPNWRQSHCRHKTSQFYSTDIHPKSPPPHSHCCPTFSFSLGIFSLSPFPAASFHQNCFDVGVFFPQEVPIWNRLTIHNPQLTTINELSSVWGSHFPTLVFLFHLSIWCLVLRGWLVCGMSRRCTPLWASTWTMSPAPVCKSKKASKNTRIWDYLQYYHCIRDLLSVCIWPQSRFATIVVCKPHPNTSTKPNFVYFKKSKNTWPRQIWIRNSRGKSMHLFATQSRDKHAGAEFKERRFFSGGGCDIYHIFGVHHQMLFFLPMLRGGTKSMDFLRDRGELTIIRSISN